MASIMDLLKSRKKEIYGNNGLIYLESRGIVNPARAVALAASSPTAIADMIGNAVAGVAGGSAKRPSDTIYKNITPLSKPISLAAPTEALLKASIEGSGDRSVSSTTPYFVKTSPNPGANLYNDIKNAVKSPGGLQSAAITALNKYGSKDGIQKLKDFRNQLKNPTESDTYGPQWSTAGNTARKPKEKTQKYSEYYKKYDTKEEAKASSNAKLTLRKKPVLKNEGSPWDQINYKILTNLGKESGITDEELSNFKTTAKETTNVPYVLFQLYGKTNSNILLPGTISGISEDYAPEVNSFRFVGSPFNLYRYGGVERSLKFDLKMYYLDEKTKISMKKNLDKLRMLTFPDENITTIQYPSDKNNSKQYSPLAFNPNLVYLTINGLYNRMLGIIDSLSISIDDTTSWSGMNFSGGEESKDINLYPNIINVSLGMKIIEHPNVEFTEEYSDKNVTGTEPVSIPKFAYGQSTVYQNNQYVNYFTGYDNNIK